MRLARNRAPERKRVTSVRRRRLNCYGNWRSRLKETNRRIRGLRRLVGIETEVIQSAPANRIRVLVLGKGLRVPAQSARSLVRSPGRVAKSRVSLCSVVWKSRMIRRSVKPKVAHRDPASQRNTEGLNRAIEILVIDGVFIMPDSRGRVGHLVANHSDSIEAGSRLEGIDARSRPGIDRRQGWHGGADRIEEEKRRAGDAELAIGDIVVHIAFAGMTLAPGVFVRNDILAFGEIGRAHVLRCAQIAHGHKDSV